MTNRDSQKQNTESVIFASGLVMLITFSLMLAWAWNKLPPELPWFYSLPWGDQQLIPKWGMAVALFFLSLVYLLNKRLATWVAGEDAITTRAVLLGGVIVVILFISSIARVIDIFI